MTSSHTRPSILSAPGAAALLRSSIFARLPLAMFSLALLVHAQRLTGSFAVAGLVSGAYAISGAVSAPVLGRLVDRCGQTTVLVSGATLTALVLLTTGLLPASSSPLLLVALAAASGASTPPLAACTRTLLPAIAADPSGLLALFAFESTVLELTFVFGPPLALALGALWSTGAALALSGLVMLVSTIAFAAQPASRRWRPEPDTPRPRGGSLRSPAMRTLALILLGTGAVFGAVDVGVIAAAKALGSTAAAGPLLGLWGVGSLLGGIAATSRGGRRRGRRTGPERRRPGRIRVRGRSRRSRHADRGDRITRTEQRDRAAGRRGAGRRGLIRETPAASSGDHLSCQPCSRPSRRVEPSAPTAGSTHRVSSAPTMTLPHPAQASRASGTIVESRPDPDHATHRSGPTPSSVTPTHSGVFPRRAHKYIGTIATLPPAYL